ncbi:outer membrane protein [Dankookia sp. GCM10030260]|uniref:outer membrane protein n=1 Tax=Dankookia sp. GCM10030260 TaxID=3273390 RepID=UPI0036186307
MTFTKTVLHVGFLGSLSLMAATGAANGQTDDATIIAAGTGAARTDGVRLGTAPTSGFYIAAAAGANWRQDADLTLQGAGADTARAMGLGTTGKLGFAGAGPVAVGSLGWGFGNGLRAEVEFGYRSSDVDAVSVAGYPAHPTLSGEASTHAVMANAFYDFHRLGWRVGVPVTPYAGLGGGYAWSSYDRITARSGNDGSMTYGVDGRFAYQAILGLAWDLSGIARGLSLTSEYRYFAVLDQQVEHGARFGRAGFRDARVDTTNRNHALLVGLRYAFRGPGPGAVGVD